MLFRRSTPTANIPCRFLVRSYFFLVTSYCYLLRSYLHLLCSYLDALCACLNTYCLNRIPHVASVTAIGTVIAKCVSSSISTTINATTTNNMVFLGIHWTGFVDWLFLVNRLIFVICNCLIVVYSFELLYPVVGVLLTFVLGTAVRS